MNKVTTAEVNRKSICTYGDHIALKMVILEKYMWQSWVEIEYYSVLERNVFKVW